MSDYEKTIDRIYEKVETAIIEDGEVTNYPPDEIKVQLWDALHDVVGDWKKHEKEQK